MSIQPSLRFNQATDQVTGFEDVGFHKVSQTVANLFLVFMLRGNYRAWKQPIAYYFVSHSVIPAVLRQIIHHILIEVHNTGIEVGRFLNSVILSYIIFISPIWLP